MLAPIILFVYNRPDHTLRTLNALCKNTLAKESILYINADGPKINDSLDNLAKIKEVRNIIRQQRWCKNVIIEEKDENLGLASSIIEGVTKIVNRHGKVIVLEDDIVTSKGFLKYMNDALDIYENEKRVYSVSGYMFPHKEELPETFFYNVPLCWGWATWQRAWSIFEDNALTLIQNIDANENWNLYDKFGNGDLKKQLYSNSKKKIDTWFVKWHASIFLKKGFCLFPNKSLVNNIGFDMTGEHCNVTNVFDHKILTETITVNKAPLHESEKARHIILKHYKRYSKKPKLLYILIKVRSKIINLFRKIVKIFILKLFPKLKPLFDDDVNFYNITSSLIDSEIGLNTRFFTPYHIRKSKIGDYTYIAQNSYISKTDVGKFCSIGPNVICGWGIHPTNGLSTAPMFYSTFKQNGISLSNENKVVESKSIKIGNDVFVGANVTILDGVTIGTGAVIGAGAVVSKDIPPYSIAVGSPIRIIKYRFEDEKIEKMLKIKWWDFSDSDLKNVEKYFFQIEKFIDIYYNDNSIYK